jgi:hypothetical protein
MTIIYIFGQNEWIKIDRKKLKKHNSLDLVAPSWTDILKVNQNAAVNKVLHNSKFIEESVHFFALNQGFFL